MHILNLIEYILLHDHDVHPLTLKRFKKKNIYSSGYQDTVTFDAFCPSLVKKGTLQKRCCSTCGQYFPSIAANTRHQAAHSALEVPAEITAEQNEPMACAHATENAPIFRNIFDVMQGPFAIDE